jgi:NADPH:quinone reductase-like Zn-dependent oxidoreductase
MPYAGHFLVKKDSTPCLDFAGIIVKPAPGSQLKAGQAVYGVSLDGSFVGGALSEYAVTDVTTTVELPEGLDSIDAASCGIASITALYCLDGRVKKGDHVFINGGSGGTGIFGMLTILSSSFLV